MTMQIKDLKVGEKVDLFGLITTIKEKVDTNKKKYLDLLLEDKTGSVYVKFWQTSLEDLMTFGDFECGKLVKIRATVDKWQENKQLIPEKSPKDNKIPLIRLANEDDGVNVEDYVKCAPIESKLMLENLFDIIKDFENETLKVVCDKVLTENEEKLIYFPGAQIIHHAMKGGLLYHIHTMVQLAIPIGDRYPNINKELLLSGVIVHDIGKLSELDSDTNGKVANYTKEGSLLGHTIQGIKMLNTLIRDLEVDYDTILLLEHMIASHHFDETWGAYQKPAFVEAEILHHLDMIDSRASMIAEITDNLETNEFSESMSYLNKRKIFRHAL